MSLAVQANLRVAAAANDRGRDPAMNIGFRTGAMVGMLTVGLGLLGRQRGRADLPGRGAARARGLRLRCALLAMFMRVGGGIFTKAADVGADLVGKVSRTSPRTTRATPRPSPTTWATTWVTAPAWPPTCSSRTP
jgi:K(+)-stimulated pyrophosphate-energized sodium pump